MAQIIKQIAIKKGTGWEKREIGTDWNKVYLTSPLLGQNSGKTLDEALNSCFPQDGLESGLLESDNGKIKSSKINSNTITELGTRISTLENFFINIPSEKDQVPEKKTDWIKDLIQQYITNNWNALITGKTNTNFLRTFFETQFTNHGYQPASMDNLTHFYTTFSNTLFPVGSIFMVADDLVNEDFDPKDTLGGEWERIRDKFLIDTENIIEEGKKQASFQIKLTRSKNVSIKDHPYQPTGSITNNFIAAKTDFPANVGASAGSLTFMNRLVITNNSNIDNIISTFTGENATLSHDIIQPEFTAVEHTIDIIPPYYKVRIWKRTAPVGAGEMVSYFDKDWGNVLLSKQTIGLWQKVDPTPVNGEPQINDLSTNEGN